MICFNTDTLSLHEKRSGTKAAQSAALVPAFLKCLFMKLCILQIVLQLSIECDIVDWNFT